MLVGKGVDVDSVPINFITARDKEEHLENCLALKHGLTIADSGNNQVDVNFSHQMCANVTVISGQPRTAVC